MRIFIKPPPQQLGATTARAVRRRLLLALATVAPQVATLAVRLLPGENDSLPGCRLVLRLTSGSEQVIERYNSGPLEAVSQAAAQADRWVRRQLLTVALATTLLR